MQLHPINISSFLQKFHLQYFAQELKKKSYLQLCALCTVFTIYDISHNSKRPGLVDNLPLLNGLFVGVLAAMALNTVLFYWQMWKPMVEEEEAEQRDSEAFSNLLPGSEEGK